MGYQSDSESMRTRSSWDGRETKAGLGEATSPIDTQDRNGTRRLGRLAAAAVAGLLGLAATQAWAENVLTIGVIAPLSGPAANWGKALAFGPQAAANEVNANGGLKVGGESYTVKVVAYDEQYKASEALAAARRLVDQDGVSFIMGPLSSAGVATIKDVLNENKVLAFHCSFLTEGVNPSYPYLYRAVVSAREFGPAMISALKEQLPTAKNVALLNPNDATGWDAGKVLEDTYRQAGFNIVSSELYERTVQDFLPLLTRILATNPDLIEVGFVPPGTAGIIVKQARELGYKGHFAKTGGPGTEQIVGAAGKEGAEGFYTWLIADEGHPAFVRLQEQYQKAGNREKLNTLAATFYDATQLLFAAIGKAGTLDPKQVNAAIHTVDSVPSLGGTPMKLVGKDTYGIDNQIRSRTYLGQITDGVAKIVGTLD